MLMKYMREKYINIYILGKKKSKTHSITQVSRKNLPFVQNTRVTVNQSA